MVPEKNRWKSSKDCTYPCVEFLPTKTTSLHQFSTLHGTAARHYFVEENGCVLPHGPFQPVASVPSHGPSRRHQSLLILSPCPFLLSQSFEDSYDLHLGEGSSSDHISSNNSNAQLLFDDNQIPQNWSTFGSFPEQLEMPNLTSESSSFNPVYYSAPTYDYNNSVVAPYDQYNISGASYQVPSYPMAYPSTNENTGANNVALDYNVYNQNQYVQNNMAYYQQNWNPNSAAGYSGFSGYSGYTTHNVEQANQPYYPSGLYKLLDPNYPSSSTANAPKSLEKTIKQEEPLPDEQIVSSTSTAEEPKPAPPSNEQAVQKPAGRRRTRISIPNPLGNLERVFIWDLDETLVLLNSLLNGSFATRFEKNLEEITGLGSKLETLILDVADRYFFYREVEAYQHVHSGDPITDDSGQDLPGIVRYDFSNLSKTHSREVVQLVRIADRYRLIKEKYNQYRGSVQGLLNMYERARWVSLTSNYEQLTGNWGALAKGCLKDIDARKNCLNVLVTSSQFVPALVKILLYDLGTLFPIENIYCATKINKLACFERITSRFSMAKCTFVVIGDGPEEEKAAKEMNFPFWRVSRHEDLMGLFCALEKEYL